MKFKNKFNAKKTVRDGMIFHSQKEARYYDQLVLAKKSGLVLFFLRQVPFHLPGNVKYVLDFQIFYADGYVRFVDVKGVRTPQFIKNKKMVEALFPIIIEEV